MERSLPTVFVLQLIEDMELFFRDEAHSQMYTLNITYLGNSAQFATMFSSHHAEMALH